MEREFIHMPEFDKQWNSIGLDDDDLRELQNVLKETPQIGAVMQGTGGLRKMRFAFDSKGKSGGIRVCYVDFVVYEKILLITVYAKSKKENLSQAERGKIKAVIEEITITLKN